MESQPNDMMGSFDLVMHIRSILITKIYYFTFLKPQSADGPDNLYHWPKKQ